MSQATIFNSITKLHLKDVMKGDHELNSYENPNDINRQRINKRNSSLGELDIANV